MAKKNYTAAEFKKFMDQCFWVSQEARGVIDLANKSRLGPLENTLGDSHMLQAVARDLIEVSMRLHNLHENQDTRRKIEDEHRKAGATY